MAISFDRCAKQIHPEQTLKIESPLSRGASGDPTLVESWVFAKIGGMERREDLRAAQNEGFPLAATGTLLELAVRIQGF